MNFQRIIRIVEKNKAGMALEVMGEWGNKRRELGEEEKKNGIDILALKLRRNWILSA